MKIRLVFVVLALSLTVGCGGSTPTPTPTPKQLDPQGNWRFVLTDTSSNTMTVGLELFELAPPAVTSNTGLGYAGTYANTGRTTGVAGTVSGTDTITMTLTISSGKTVDATYDLTGTIATDQQHLNGTFTSSAPCCDGSPVPGWPQASGTFTAVLIAPVTGTWNGTLTAINSGATGTLTLVLTEDTSQTDTTMGQVTGNATLTGACSDSWTFAPYSAGAINSHVGDFVSLSATATSGVVLVVNTNPLSWNADGSFTLDGGYQNAVLITGGPCDGDTFAGTFTLQ